MKILCCRLRLSKFTVLSFIFIFVVMQKVSRIRNEVSQQDVATDAVQYQRIHVPETPAPDVPALSAIDIKLDLSSEPIQFPDEQPNYQPANVINDNVADLPDNVVNDNVADLPANVINQNVAVAPLQQTDKKLKTILLWNPFFKSEDYYFGIGQQPFVDNECAVQTCMTTRDHSYLDTADVVVVHGPRVDEPMPAYRPPGQLYGYVQAEPHYNGSMTYLPTMGDMFNITLTNRRDSDVYIAYGIVTPSKAAARGRGSTFVSPFSKAKSVVWAVSHCNTPGRRERYVVELQKHHQVDIYGACGPLVCPKSDECMEMFTRDYKFYLSLENHYCKDYVSEKLYRTLEYDIIPIVFGGADYSKDAPPHSVINIVDYPDPKVLAEYLDYLSNNATAYNEYFEWKKHYVIEHYRHVIYGGVFCRLCEILHDPAYEYRDYTNLYSWWVDGMCDANVVGRMARKYGWFVENFRF